jgi:hypothetical protein
VPTKKNGLPSMTKEVPERETKPVARFGSSVSAGEDSGWRTYADAVIAPRRMERIDDGRMVNIGIK